MSLWGRTDLTAGWVKLLKACCVLYHAFELTNLLHFFCKIFLKVSFIMNIILAWYMNSKTDRQIKFCGDIKLFGMYAKGHSDQVMGGLERIKVPSRASFQKFINKSIYFN